MKIVVKIGGFMIEKTPNPNHNHNFSRGSTHNPNYSTILSEKSTQTSTTIYLNFYITHNLNNTTIW